MLLSDPIWLENCMHLRILVFPLRSLYMCEYGMRTLEY